MESMIANSSTYRWFLISGSLLIHGTPNLIVHGAYADDLPTGADGTWAIAERLRRQIAQEHNDPYVQWDSLDVREVAPSLAWYVLGLETS